MPSSSVSVTSPVIVWLRNDMRLHDNPALYHASKMGVPVICVYIDDTVTPCRDYYASGAVRVWNHHALVDLQKNIQQIGGNVWIFQGNPYNILTDIIQKTGAKTVFWNRLYAPSEIARDTAIKSSLKESGIEVKTFSATFLNEPHTVLNKEGGFYKVYTPYRKAVESRGLEHALPPCPVPDSVMAYSESDIKSLHISDIFPLPIHPDWASNLVGHWDISESAAHKHLSSFAKNRMEHYKTGRDFPAQNYVSYLSPYLARGMITPHFILNFIKNYPESAGKTHFISEILWREFSGYLLFHFPYMQQTNFRPVWDNFPWEHNESLLKSWKTGQTGIPIIDAGMRQLRQTGYMHNRVRMLVGSFLVKHLLINWTHGESWFRDNLFDFDVANNIAGWQWVAGSGADAAPYFRIFNPILQSKKFDGDAVYIKKYVPELSKLPADMIHAPFDYSDGELIGYGVILGKTYPKPIVDIMQGRDKALELYKKFNISPQDESGT